ncbi:MAG: SDR family oxidoreductase [SAR202 cluster bacterium]|nr:SDR family oxidoreductase [SAR202 cluster bacterium]
MRPVLILGATSTIARHAALALAKRGHTIYLAGRNRDELARIAADINTRTGMPVATGRFEAGEFEGHAALLEDVLQQMGGLYGVVYAAGYQGVPHASADLRAKDAATIMSSNLTGAVSILERCAAYLERQRSGFILGISSVAGDRGRQSNYIYGASKSGLHTYLQGLRHRMAKSGVRVVSIKPGFVDTPMTAGMKKGLLMASPAKVGERIARATEKGPTTAYVPFFWRFIMLIIRNIPERIFHKTKL